MNTIRQGKEFGAHKQPWGSPVGSNIVDEKLFYIRHRSVIMNTLWYLKQFVLLMSALWIPSSIYIIRDQHKAIANINQVLKIPIAQKKTIQRLCRNVISNYDIVKRKTERNKEEKISSLTDQREVITNLLWLAVGICGLFIIVSIKMFATKARIKSEDKVASSSKSGGRKRKIRVETVNQGIDYVIFTFTRNTERFLKTPRCAMMTQLKQLPCFAEKLVQEIYIPDNPELGPLETSLGNVKGCICVYEYNDRDIILELPTDLETKKRDSIALLIKASNASGLRLLVVYMFDPRSSKLWDGEIYNTLIGQTYGNDILKGVANAGQFISINKEFIKLQLDQIQTILQ
ncbi:unnamed protein product [Owenia fusiformis]|uniref:Uncharacterized protein n=1 Tax=Owenia fusiformis TaxID=6347 RepID=A0A8J1TF40_OWEFU|nr:unnamed protein product [Owenia fusiformis]